MQNYTQENINTNNNNTAMEQVINAINKWKNDLVSERRFQPWSIFVDKTRFSVPRANEVMQRIPANILRFTTNYLIIFFILFTYCIFSNLWFLVALLVIIGSWFMAFIWFSKIIKIGPIEINDRLKIFILIPFTLIIFYFASVGSIIFWLLGATFTLVLLHSAFMEKVSNEDLGSKFSFMLGV